MNCTEDKKDLFLFAIDETQSDIKKRIVPIEFLNLKNIPTEDMNLNVQPVIDQFAQVLAPYGYHIWVSDKYIENTEK